VRGTEKLPGSNEENGVSSIAGCQPSGASQDGGVRRLIGRIEVPFRLHLWEDRTRGELWVPSYDPATLVLLGDDYLRIASGNAVDSGRRTFEFKPVAAGVHRIVFEKRLGWKFTSEHRQVYEITVPSSVIDGDQ
jgi:hypothetical protein